MIQSLLVGFMSICLLLYSSCGQGQTFIKFLRANNMFIVSRARKQLLISLCMQYINTHPSGFALRICASILHTNLGNWSKTIAMSYDNDNNY